MKRHLLLITLTILSLSASAQIVTIKKDTIFNGKTPYALFKKDNEALHYTIYAFEGKELIQLHYAHQTAKNKQLYIVSFLGSHQQAMIARKAGFPLSFIKEMVKSHLIDRGTAVNSGSVVRYTSLHPLPAGFIDVDQTGDPVEE